MKAKFVFGLIAVILFAALSFRIWLMYEINSAPDRPSSSVASLRSLEGKIKRYAADTGTLPMNLDNLLRNNGSPFWRGPYAQRTDLFDSQARLIRYEVIDPARKEFLLSVVGKDGATRQSIRSRL